MQRLSIIVPVYKVEPWIEKCIRSLEDQDISRNEYEIIVVNDGTPDRSAEIVRSLMPEFENIRVIDQENRRLPGARNTGIRNAKGNYLLFVDSDDYIEKDCLGEMLAFAENRDLEVAMFSQNLITAGDKINRSKSQTKETGIITGVQLFEMRNNDSACKFMIRRKYLVENNLYFFENAVFLEDAEWGPRLLAKAERTAFRNIPFYYYYLRTGSLVTSGTAVSQKALAGYVASYRNLKEFQQRDDLSSEQKYFLNQSIAKFAILPFFANANAGGLKSYSKIKKGVQKANINKLNLKGIKGMRRRHAVLFNLSKELLFAYLLIKNLRKYLLIRLGAKTTQKSN